MKSLKLKKELNDVRGLAHSYNNIGNLWIKIEQYDSALVYLEKCQEYAAQAGDSRTVSAAFNNMGNVYYDLGKYKEAQRLQERAYKLAVEIKAQVQTDIIFHKHEH